MEEVAVHCAPLPDGPVLARELLSDLPERLPQPAFERTGGLHAPACSTPRAAAAGPRGRGTAQRDGQGRGSGLLDGRLPLQGHVLCVSGRQSFELVQKAAVAGAPVLVGVGAPSSSPSSWRKTAG
jgi:FdhD protein